MKPLLTIIIPIYNVEKYIRGTLDSIFSQDTSGVEVICVNDGTPDHSMTIVDEFVAKNDNLFVINQENQGLSCARNAGLRRAKGEYIWFVDSDDTLSANALDIARDSIKRFPVDVLGFDILRLYEKDGHNDCSTIVCHHSNQKLYLSKYDISHFWGKINTGPIQRFLFNANFLRRNNLKFMPKVLHEDIEFMGRCIVLNGKMVAINQTAYIYLIRVSGSIMSSIDTKSLESRFKIIESFRRFRHNSCINRKQQLLMDCNSVEMLFYILGFKDKSTLYKSLISKERYRLKVLALKGLFAHLYLCHWRKFLKTLLVIVNFRLYSKLDRYMWR